MNNEVNMEGTESFSPAFSQWIGIFWSFLWRSKLVTILFVLIIMVIYLAGVIVAGVASGPLGFGKIGFMVIAVLSLVIPVIFTIFLAPAYSCTWFLRAKHNKFRIYRISDQGEVLPNKLKFGQRFSLGWAFIWRSILIFLPVGIIFSLITQLAIGLDKLFVPNVSMMGIIYSIVAFVVYYFFGILLLKWVLKAKFKEYSFKIVKTDICAGKGWVLWLILYLFAATVLGQVVNAVAAEQIAKEVNAEESSQQSANDSYNYSYSESSETVLSKPVSDSQIKMNDTSTTQEPDSNQL